MLEVFHSESLVLLSAVRGWSSADLVQVQKSDPEDLLNSTRPLLMKLSD